MDSKPGSVPSLRRGDFARARGWVVRADDATPVDGLSVTLAGEPAVEAIVGLSRPDVAEHLGADARKSGFEVVFPVTAPLGRQQLAFEARSGGEILPLDSACIVSIDPPSDPLAGRYERRDGWAFTIDGIRLAEGRAAEKNDPSAPDVFTLALAARAFVQLWVIDRVHDVPASGVVARAGGIYLPVLASAVRRDAAAYVGLPSAERCGFIVPVSPPLCGVGSVDLFALGCDESYAYLGAVRFRDANPLPLSALPRSGRIRGNVDEVTQTGGVLRLRGWAVDEQGPRLSGGVFASLGGGTPSQASYGGSREDIASALDAGWIAACEFNVTLDTAGLSSGRHSVSLVALTARGDAAGEFGSPLFITVPESPTT